MILIALAIAACPAPPATRHHCVHDGDTVWWEGEKIRIAEIDTPELNGRCDRERRLARQARTRLIVLVNQSPPRFERIGTDRYGRTLANEPRIAAALIREGLARRWTGRRQGWCD